MHKYDVDFYDFYNVSLCCVLRHKRECVLPFFVVLGGGFFGAHTHTHVVHIGVAIFPNTCISRFVSALIYGPFVYRCVYIV